MPNSPSVMTVVNLGMQYPDRQIQPMLTNANWSIEPGEFVAIVGPNGVGKTSLLKALAGLSRPIHGQILLGDQDLFDLTHIERAKQIAFVDTKEHIPPLMKVDEYIALGRTPYLAWTGKLEATDQDFVLQIGKELHLDCFWDRKVSTLSDGERQRAMLARALAQQTPILCLDEPTAFLDVAAKFEILALLQKIAHKQNKTVIMTSHDFDHVCQVVDQVWLYPWGGPLLQATPEEIMINGQLNQVFQSRNVEYLSEVGQFRIRNQAVANIQLIGEGLPRQITEQALSRLGFEVNDQAEISIEIIHQNSLHWKYKHAQLEQNFTSLQELLRFLRITLQK